jgi:DNA-binding NarL/FixJ family response regulator
VGSPTGNVKDSENILGDALYLQWEPSSSSLLSFRELDVLRLVSAGLTNREVADALCV